MHREDYEKFRDLITRSDHHGKYYFVRKYVVPSVTSAESQWISKIEEARAALERSDRELYTVDYGAGTKRAHHSSSGSRLEKREKLGDLCRRRSMKPKRALALFGAVRVLKPRRVLELGTCVGISTAYMAVAVGVNSLGSIVTIEGCPALAEIARENLREIGIACATVVTGRFADTLPELLPTVSPLDCVLIDGHHDGQATQRYFDDVSSRCDSPAVIVIDDIHWSADMRRAWQVIRRKSVVSHSAEFSGFGAVLLS